MAAERGRAEIDPGWSLPERRDVNISMIEAVPSANLELKETGVSRERCWESGKLKPVELRCFPAAFFNFVRSG